MSALHLSDFCLITTFSASQLHLFSILKWISVLDLSKSCPLLWTWLHCHKAKQLYERQPLGKLERGQPTQQTERLFLVAALQDCLTAEGLGVQILREDSPWQSGQERHEKVASCAIRTGHTHQGWARGWEWPSWLTLQKIYSSKEKCAFHMASGCRWLLCLYYKRQSCGISISLLSCQVQYTNLLLSVKSK